MTGVCGLDSYAWRTDEWAIASLAVRCEDLFARHGIVAHRWEEDGLGPAVGGALRLPSGRVVLLVELAHAITHHGARGPDMYAEAGDVASLGVTALVGELLEGLELRQADLGWVSSASREEAADAAARAVARREKRSHGGQS